MGSIGDVARGLPIAWSLKQHNPDSHVAWLVEPRCEPLVRGFKGIDQVLVFERRWHLASVLRVRRALRELNADVVLDLQRHGKSGFLSWLSGSPRRLAFHRRDSKEFNFLFSTETIPEMGEDVAKFNCYAKFLEVLGVPLHWPGAEAWREPVLSERGALLLEKVEPGAIGVVLGSSWESKNWVKEGYQDLVIQLGSGLQRQVVLLGTGNDSGIAQALVSGPSGKNLLDTVGALTLADVVEIVRRCSLLIGPDSGPGHIAATVGVPQVTLFGPTSSKRTAPRGFEHLSIQAPLGCRPCYRRECPGLKSLCMRLIPVAEVVEMARVALTPAR